MIIVSIASSEGEGWGGFFDRECRCREKPPEPHRLGVVGIDIVSKYVNADWFPKRFYWAQGNRADASFQPRYVNSGELLQLGKPCSSYRLILERWYLDCRDCPYADVHWVDSLLSLM
jgi:hypothetical protein